jgi:cellulose synthase/poly-beta-1,6-N-acetylglucosamine synthase-like glycosyltransferase
MLIIIFLVLYLILWGAVLFGIGKNRKNIFSFSNSGSTPFLSLLIPFHNEKNFLAETLNSLLKQTLGEENYEVIWIDDRSDDSGASVLEKNIVDLKNHQLIKIVEEPEDKRGKRAALNTGAKLARGSVLVFSDADCRFPEKWLENIYSLFNSRDLDVYSGTVIKESSGFLGGMLQIETSLHSALGQAMIGLGFPTLAFGANWAVKTELFKKAGAFNETGKSLSGDDDLLLQKLSGLTKKIFWDPDNIIYTRGASDWQEWFRQKRRHIGASRYYRKEAKLFYGIYHSSFLIISLSLLIDFKFIIALFIKIISDFVLVKSCPRKGGFIKRITRLFIFQYYYVFENWFVGLFALIFQTKRW